MTNYKLKMKISSILIALICFTSNAQKIIVNYSEKSIISAERLEKIPEFARDEVLKSKLFTLTYSNGVSLYEAVSTGDDNKTIEKTKTIENKTDDLTEITIRTEKITTKESQKVFYKNYLDKEMLFIWPMGQENLSGKDTLQEWNWEITNETKTIEGFKCKKATSNWLGYNFTAWYTEDIEISIGPDKFDGLPGLILYLYTPHSEWKATKINQTNEEDVIIKKPDFKQNKTYTLSEINGLFLNTKKSTKTIKQDGNTTITTEKL